MAKTKKPEAKKRIFDAATSLFARKGFFAVGIREIAKEADVNISMINYYFGGKVGILKAIIDECYDRYYGAISDVGDDNTSTDEWVRLIVRKVVQFFRENTELAMVAFSTLPVDIPEILDFKMKWVCGRRKATDEHFTRLDLDTNDVIQMHVIRGVITAIVSSHFESRYVWDHVKRAPIEPGSDVEEALQQCCPQYDDAFYEQYSQMVADLYLHGLSGITAKNQPKKEGDENG